MTNDEQPTSDTLERLTAAVRLNPRTATDLEWTELYVQAMNAVATITEQGARIAALEDALADIGLRLKDAEQGGYQNDLRLLAVREAASTARAALKGTTP